MQIFRGAFTLKLLVIRVVLVLIRAIWIVRFFGTCIVPAYEAKLVALDNAVVLSLTLFIAAGCRKIGALRVTLVILKAQHKLSLWPLFIVETAIIVVLIKREILVLANDDFMTATVQSHAWSNHQLALLPIPVNIETANYSPAKHHAINQVALVVEVRLLLLQIANGELLTEEIVVPLKGIGGTNTAFRILVWLHI